MTGLMFLPIIVGVMIGVVTAPLINRHYVGMAKKCTGRPPPELRLIPLMFSSWLVPMGMFIFAVSIALNRISIQTQHR